MKKINKYSLIKVAGVFAICLVTFFNSQSSIVTSENQGTLDLNKLVSINAANAEDDGAPWQGFCWGWGSPCRAVYREGQKEAFVGS
jgi:hypothetical protein